MSKRIVFCLVLCTIAFSTISFSQSKQFQHINSLDGLSQSEVYSFLEDSRGYFWIGTVDGLNRYDGYNIITFYTDKDNPNSITNNTIRCLAEDDQGRIWIGTDDGLSLYDSEAEKIHQIAIPGFEEMLLTVNAIIVKGRQLYLATTVGLYILKIDTKELEKIGNTAQFFKLPNDYPVNNAVSIELSKNGNIWLIISTGLYYLDFVEGSDIPTPTEVLEIKDQITDLRSLKEDSFGNLWMVSHNHGFLRFNPSTEKLSHFKTNSTNKSVISDKGSSVASDRDGNLWIGTHDRGLLFIQKDDLNDISPLFQSIQNNPFDDRSLSSNLIYSLYVSKSNLLWIGTIASGVNIYDPYRKPFNYYNVRGAAGQTPQSTNFVRAVFADRSDNIWIGMHNNGIFHLDRANNKITKIGFGTESIFHITSSNDENILVCTGQGISLVRKIGDKLEILSTLEVGPVFYAVSGDKNVFWIAGFRGVGKCKILNGKLFLEQEYTPDSDPRISFHNCRVLFFSKETQELFIGTEGGGLNILQMDNTLFPLANRVYKTNDSPNAISNNYIRSIIKGSDSNIWIGTYEGLNKMETDAVSSKVVFTTYTTVNGLPNNTIQSIVEDQQKKLWIGTNGGLCSFNPQTEVFTQYTINEGIQSNEFSEHAIFKKNDDEIIIGGINGINTFYPKEITSMEIMPNTTLTDFYLSNKKVDVSQYNTSGQVSPLKKSITLTDSIFLKPNQNSFGFEFSAMIYSAPEKVLYAYMLEGFDKEWNYTDAKNRRANYTNLEYGSYIFKVKSTKNDGSWEESPQSVFVNIKTPFYRTKVAYVAYTLLALLAIVFFTNYTAIRSTTKKKILLENEHNKKVRELEEFRSRFFINISHDLRTPLTLITSPLEIALKSKNLKPEVKQYLNVVQRNVEKLNKMIEELLDARKIEMAKPIPKPQRIDIVSFINKEASLFEHSLKEKGLNLNINTEEELMNTSFDPGMISKVVFNILSNALKYTKEGEINIDISNVENNSVAQLANTKYESFTKIKIQDSGKGIDESDLDLIFERFYQAKGRSTKGYGIGLSHSKDLVKAHEGIITVESKKGIGTAFSIYIPNPGNLPEIEQIKPVVTQNQNSDMNTDEQVFVIEEKNLSKISTPKILLVEDNTDLRNFIANELGKTYQVFNAVDGENGLEMAKKHFPDLIISDIMMPKMDGIRFCEKIKTNIKTSHIPVILLTAKVNKESKHKGLEIGADDYISKPFEIDYLLLRIKNLLDNRDRLRKMFKVNAALEPVKVTVTSIDEEFLNHLMLEIEKGIPDAEFTITALERELGMSHSSFYNKIKSLTGRSAKELMLSARMKRAMQILEDTSNIRIAEVAYMVGFSDPKYFSKSFKEYHGISPSDVLKKNKNKS